MRLLGPKLSPRSSTSNAKAYYALFQALTDDNIAMVIHCKSAFEIWSHLTITHEGISQVKKAKIDLLRSQYEKFLMNEDEFIDDMIIKFTKITNSLATLGDKIDNDQKVRKVIPALLPSWEVKFTTLKELNDKEKMELIGIIENLKIHEMAKKSKGEKAPKRKRLLLSNHSYYFWWRRWWSFILSYKEC